jgi:uncharacterized caspase-like protein
MKGMLRYGWGLLCGILLAQPSAPRIEKKVALVIGNDAYLYVAPLRTATNDARSVQAILRQRYGFETTLLLNATRSQIVSALNAYRRDLGPDSSLLIYYAGHGYYDKAVDKAYWWPVDAQNNDNTNWISAADITSNIKGTASRHVLIVSDSCYSGTLRGVSVPQNLNGLNSDRARTLLRLEQRPSRELMASGGNEPVSDSGADGHSVFAGAFLRALERMPAEQFAAHELFDEVRTFVAGNSAQLPQFDPLRDSGDDGGSFVFSRAGGVVPVVTPGHARGDASLPPAPKPMPPADTHKYLPKDPLPPPPEPGYEPTSMPHTALLMLRDNPKFLTDEVALKIALQQVAVEQSMWTFIAEALRLNPRTPQFTYEWQTLIDQRPDFARGPLVGVFNKGDADWSFLKNEKGWNGQTDSIVDVFMFARNQVMGEDGKPKDNAFTAQRLRPVVKKHLEAAVAKAPSKLWFIVKLPHADYDFNSSAMRFRKDQNTFEDSLDLLDLVASPVFEPTPAPGMNTAALPAAARTTANYQWWSGGHLLMPDSEPTVKPGSIFKTVEGIALFSPAAGWRDNFTRLARIAPVDLHILALDRQLRLGSIPMDAGKAEALHPLMSALMRAQVFIDVERGQSMPMTISSGTMPVAVLFARVTKIKIIDYLGEVVVTLEPKSLPLPGGK